MNAKNTNLLKAKKEANDEFYTQYEDIAKEIEHYKEHLKGEENYRMAFHTALKHQYELVLVPYDFFGIVKNN